MVTDNHYRWDFVGLSTDVKPTPATSEKVVDGSTFYCSDNSKLYVYCKNNWYERKPLGGGGGGTSYTAGDGIDLTEDTISVNFSDIGSRKSYYVDGTNGNDNNTGTSTSTAFKTLEKALNMANTYGSNISITIRTAGTYAIPSSIGYITGKSIAIVPAANVSGIIISLADRVRLNNCYFEITGTSSAQISVVSSTVGSTKVLETQSSEIVFNYVNFNEVSIYPKGSTIRFYNGDLYCISSQGSNVRLNNVTVLGTWTGSTSPIYLAEGSDGELGTLIANARSTALNQAFVTLATGSHLAVSGALTNNTEVGTSYTYGIYSSNSTIQENASYVSDYEAIGSGLYLIAGSLIIKDNVSLPYSDFTGTDGEDDGEAGLVPAPTTSDVNKYLKSDGTWATVSGGSGGVRTLTTADYNYPVNNPTYINLGLFDPGIYFVDDNARIYDGHNANNYRSSYTFVVTGGDGDSTIRNIMVIYPAATASSTEYKISFFYTFTNNPYPWTSRGNVLSSDYIVNNLTTNNASRVLSAAQGKDLKDLIDALDVRVSALEGN